MERADVLYRLASGGHCSIKDCNCLRYRTKTLTSEIPDSTIRFVSQSFSLSDSSIIQDAENPCMRINVGRCVLTSMEDKGDVFSELYRGNKIHLRLL